MDLIALPGRSVCAYPSHKSVCAYPPHNNYGHAADLRMHDDGWKKLTWEEEISFR